MSRRNLTGPSSRRTLAAAISACAVSALTLAVLSSGPAAAHEHGGDGTSADRAQADPDEAKVIGKEHAEEHAMTRKAIKAVGEYPQSTRTERLKALGASQAKVNADFDAMDSGRFREYFQSPDFAAHIAMLPTGKVLLFSFERIESNPQKEPAPTDTIGKENAGRAYLWDPAKGTGPDSYTKVTPP